TFTVKDPDEADDSGTYKFTIEPKPPTSPGLNSPPDNSEITDDQPTLSVNNSTSSVGNLTYDFELALDAAFSNLVESESDISEGTNITSWVLSERFPALHLTENTTYYWRARAFDSLGGEGEWMTTASFFMNEFNEMPSTPGISYPSDGSEVDTLNPIFEITNSIDPDMDDLTYEFEVYDFEFNDNADPGGTPISSKTVIQESDGTTSCRFDINLEDNSSYWWRFRAVDEHGLSGEWAGPFDFIVNKSNSAPSRPELLSPATNSEVDLFDPTVIISNSIDEDYDDKLIYIFQLYKESNYENLLDEETVSEGTEGKTSCKFYGLEENTKYYWRVKASDGSAESQWLSSSFIVNTVNDPPGIPVLRYPASDITVRSTSIILKAEKVNDPDGDAVSYLFEICKSGGECVQSDQISNPEWKQSGLKNDTEYIWAVQAIDDNSEKSEWSENRSFKVITNYTPNPPKLNSPVSGGTVSINSPVILSVKNSQDNDGDKLFYHFEIYSDAQLSDLVETGSMEEGDIITEYEVNSGLSDGAEYYWRVYATDGENNSSYSSTFSFVCSSAEPEYDVDVVESRVVYSSMLNGLEDGEYYDVSVSDNTSKLNGVIISIPKGAVDKDLNLTIGETTKMPALPSGVVITGRVIHFGPEGTHFDVPVLIKVPYTEEDLNTANVSDPLELRLYTYSDSTTGWEILEPVSADTGSSLLVFEVNHFSIFTFGIETGDTGTGSGDSPEASSGGGGGGCFIATVEGGANIISHVTNHYSLIWGLLLIGGFAILLFRILK
ncbi:MAG: hypothetical protein PVG39_27600, partial [Desulfobacteraceae bacterium]